MFDKVWYDGLIYKSKPNFPENFNNRKLFEKKEIFKFCFDVWTSYGFTEASQYLWDHVLNLLKQPKKWKIRMNEYRCMHSLIWRDSCLLYTKITIRYLHFFKTKTSVYIWFHSLLGNRNKDSILIKVKNFHSFCRAWYYQWVHWL